MSNCKLDTVWEVNASIYVYDLIVVLSFILQRQARTRFKVRKRDTVLNTVTAWLRITIVLFGWACSVVCSLSVVQVGYTTRSWHFSRSSCHASLVLSLWITGLSRSYYNIHFRYLVPFGVLQREWCCNRRTRVHAHWWLNTNYHDTCTALICHTFPCNYRTCWRMELKLSWCPLDQRFRFQGFTRSV